MVEFIPLYSVHVEEVPSFSVEVDPLSFTLEIGPHTVNNVGIVNLSAVEVRDLYYSQVPKVSTPEITAGDEVEVRRYSVTDVVALIDEHAPSAIADAHYAPPLADLPALRALTEASLIDKERRYIESEISDYFYDVDASSGDEAPDDQTGGTGFWLKVVTSADTAASIKIKYESNPDTNEFDDAEKAKLGGIEGGATADLSAAEVMALYESNVDTNKFDNAEQNKLLGIEINATKDMTVAEIRVAVDAGTNSNVFTDGDLGKLQAIEPSATIDQTGPEIKVLYEGESKAFTDAQFDKLATIQSGATDEQTGAEIKIAYLDEPDTNNFDDAALALLATVETGATADQSNAEIEAAYNAQVAKVSAPEIAAGTEAAVRRVSPADVVALIDTHAPSAIDDAHYQDPLSDLAELTFLPEASLADKERRYVESEVADYFYDQDATSGDEQPDDQTGGTGFWITVAAGGEGSPSAIKIKYESNADTNEFDDAEKTLLGTVETGATADQTDAEIRAATAAATDSNVYNDAAVSKLAGIDTGATDDQTPAEIRAAVQAATDSQVFTDNDHTKLNGLDTGASDDQTGPEIKALYEAEANAYTDTKDSKLAAIEPAATADQSDAEIRAAVQAATDSQVFTDADHSKLDDLNIVTVTEHVVDYTMALTDAGDILEMNKATVIVLTIPDFATVAYPVGTIVSISMTGIGVTSITADTGVTLNGVVAGTGAMNGQWAGVSLYNRAEDVWVVQGAIGVVA
jgi:hypothetical protein